MLDQVISYISEINNRIMFKKKYVKSWSKKKEENIVHHFLSLYFNLTTK